MNGQIFLFIVLFGCWYTWYLHAKVIVDKVEVRFKAEILNGSVTYVNTKTGYSMNMSIDINEELDNISFLIAISFANPLNRQSFTEVIKYSIDGCKLQASMEKNYFVSRIFTELQKFSKLKISCPLKKTKYRIVNWTVTDDFLPKSMPRNIKGMSIVRTFTNISNKKVEIGKVKFVGEFK